MGRGHAAGTRCIYMIIVSLFPEKSRCFLCRLAGKLYLRGMERRNVALGLLLCALQNWQGASTEGYFFMILMIYLFIFCCFGNYAYI